MEIEVEVEIEIEIGIGIGIGIQIIEICMYACLSVCMYVQSVYIPAF